MERKKCMFSPDKKHQWQTRVSPPSLADEPVRQLGLLTGDLQLYGGKTYPRLEKASCLQLPAQYSGLPKPCKPAELLPPEGSISVRRELLHNTIWKAKLPRFSLSDCICLRGSVGVLFCCFVCFGLAFVSISALMGHFLP